VIILNERIMLMQFLTPHNLSLITNKPTSPRRHIN